MYKKKIKARSIVAVALLLLLCMCFLCGCIHTPPDETENLEYNIRLSGFYELENYSDCYTKEEYIMSFSQLKWYCSKVNSSAFDETDEENYNSEFNQVLRTYDDEYFEEKALIIAIHTGNLEFLGEKITAVKKEKEYFLAIEMTVTYWGGGTIAMVVPDKHWVFLIEIDKVGIVFDEYTRYEYIVEYEDDQKFLS